MGDWRVLPLEVGDAAALLARGADLLDGLAQEPVPTLRWYRSAAPTLVLGRGQATVSPQGDLPVVTRGSGGGAVVMDADLLCLDVLVPAGHPWLEGGPGAVFLPLGQAWAGAIRTLGVGDVAVHQGAGTARRRGDARDRLLAAVCYATLGRGEVTVGGRKLVGMAQRLRRPGALVQCGLLRRWRPGPLLRALGAHPDDPAIAVAAVGLDDLLQPAASDRRMMNAVAAALSAGAPAS